ncbi:MAG: hypothetical protein F6K24_52675 [Okeania sp. SIO2D1]|nr:hypothetical protein [Okeania sp. SIO2D1]
MSMLSPYPYRYGMLIGLLAGFLGGYLNRTRTISTSFRNKKDFRVKVNTVLQEIGFEEHSQEDGYLIYEKAGWKKVFSGRIFVQIQKKSASISGRAVNLQKLGEKLEL